MIHQLILLWRVRVQAKLGPNDNYDLLQSDICDFRFKTDSLILQMHSHIEFKMSHTNE